MKKVVFLHVADKGDVESLIGGAQAKFPDLGEGDVIISDSANDFIRPAATITVAEDGKKSVSYDDALVVFDPSKCSEQDNKVMARLRQMGATLTETDVRFDPSAGSDSEAIKTWIETGKFPAPAPAPVEQSDDDLFDEAFGSFDEDASAPSAPSAPSPEPVAPPAAPPMPGEDFDPEPAAVAPQAEEERQTPPAAPPMPGEDFDAPAPSAPSPEPVAPSVPEDDFPTSSDSADDDDDYFSSSPSDPDDDDDYFSAASNEEAGPPVAETHVAPPMPVDEPAPAPAPAPVQQTPPPVPSAPSPEPVAPPVPEDDFSAPAVTQEQADDFWSGVDGGASAPSVPSAPSAQQPPAAPPMPVDEPAPAPAPAPVQQTPPPAPMSAEQSDDDLFDPGHINPPPVSETAPDMDLSHNVDRQKAPIDDTDEQWPPAPTQEHNPPRIPGVTQEHSLAPATPPAPPVPEDSTPTPPAAPPMPVDEPAPAPVQQRPAAHVNSATDDLEAWASAASHSDEIAAAQQRERQQPPAAPPMPVDEPAPAPVQQTPPPAPPMPGDYDEPDDFLAASPTRRHTAESEGNVIPPASSPGYQSPPQEVSRETAGEREFATKAGIPRMPLPGTRKGTSVLITGSHGGCGKTTIAYLMPYVMAYLMQQTSGKPVYLIEADYSNPKLAQRLSLPPEQNSSGFAKFVKELSSGSASSMTREQVQEQTKAVIESITYVEPSTGLRIIACPYDTTSRNSESLRDAIQKLVNGLVSREDCYVFMDGQTFAKDDVLDSTLAATSEAVVLVGNARHVEDAKSFRHMLTTPVDTNGAGVDPDRISLFLNRTSEGRAMELANEFYPIPVVGYLPKMVQMDDSTDEKTVAWVGAELRGDALSDAVTFIAKSLSNLMPDDVHAPLSKLADRPIRGNYATEGVAVGASKKRKGFLRRK